MQAIYICVTYFECSCFAWSKVARIQQDERETGKSYELVLRIYIILYKFACRIYTIMRGINYITKGVIHKSELTPLDTKLSTHQRKWNVVTTFTVKG